MRRWCALALAVAFFACYYKHSDPMPEAALRDDLRAMRSALDNFYADHPRSPHSLDELKAAHYLRMIPKDPITGRQEWRLILESPTPATKERFVYDIQSLAPGAGRNGIPYGRY